MEPLSGFLQLSSVNRFSSRIDSPSIADRIRAGLHKVVKLLYTRLVALNMFPPRNFGSRLNQNKAKRLGQWTTRLYIVLLVASVVIWALQSAIEPRILTKSFTNPTFDEYRSLSRTHGDALLCPCSSISLKYEQFVQINPVFHQVRTHTTTHADDTRFVSLRTVYVHAR